MTSLSRAPLRALVVAAAATGSPSSPATVPSPTVTFTDGPTADEPSDQPSDEPTDDASDDAASAGTQVVKVKKFGISFELPEEWISLDAKKVLDGGTGKNPFLEELADRLGVSEEQLVRAFSTSLQTMSVSGGGASHGFLTNVNSVGQEGDLNDEQLKLQLAAIGAKPGVPDHGSSEAGPVTLFPYDLASKSFTVRGLAVAVHTAVATVIITVSSASAEESARIGHQVQRSLKTIPGTGPNA
jgi:hypothetical protein